MTIRAGERPDGTSASGTQILIVMLSVATALITACSSSSGSEQSAGPVVLENGPAQYGKTYPEWGSTWWQWLYELPQAPGRCVTPDNDATGESCNVGQKGDVFFLAGTRGGNAVRTKCVVPKGKALFFPIINYVADNGGVPADKVLSEADLKKGTDAAVSAMTDVSLKVDGIVFDTSRLRVATTKYSYTLPPEPNSYSCGGAPGVTGPISPSFHGGYYAMLAPLSPGAHKIEFAGKNGMFQLNVTYELRVE